MGANLVSVHADWYAECARQSKVCEFDDAPAVDEQVLRLEVAVNDSALVAVEDGLGQLI